MHFQGRPGRQFLAERRRNGELKQEVSSLITARFWHKAAEARHHHLLSFLLLPLPLPRSRLLHHHHSLSSSSSSALSPRLLNYLCSTYLTQRCCEPPCFNLAYTFLPPRACFRVLYSCLLSVALHPSSKSCNQHNLPPALISSILLDAQSGPVT